MPRSSANGCCRRSAAGFAVAGAGASRPSVCTASLSYSVARRTPEFGVRLALGAQPGRVAWSVVRGVLLQVALGIGLGLPFALAAVRAAEGLLFGVTSAEPWNYLLGAAALTAVACVAAALPARRAASTRPLHRPPASVSRARSSCRVRPWERSSPHPLRLTCHRGATGSPGAAPSA